MTQERTYNRTTLNGAQWQIIEDGLGVALFLKNYNKEGYHFSGYCFKTVEEANAHLDKIDEKVAHPVEFKPCVIPADYYGVAGRYYGD
jgi:hypothetical protein